MEKMCWMCTVFAEHGPLPRPNTEFVLRLTIVKNPLENSWIQMVIQIPTKNK